MKLSVVVPTYNRGDLLRRSLRALLDQAMPPRDYEILVVDDGSTDTTAEVAQEVEAAAGGRIRYLRQENRGPAAARNLGVREAKGTIVLFTGDDCIADPHLVPEHLRVHATEGDVGIVGHIAWHSELKVTAFMEFLEDGVQFGFPHIEDADNVPFWAFYTSNCSLRKSRLEEAGGFDEDFKYAAWEDIELAYRLTQRGLRLVYRPTAVTYHYHPTTLEHYLERQRLSGRAAVTFWRKHPELAQMLNIPHAGHPAAVRQLYRAAVTYAFSLGVRDALRGEDTPLDNELDALYADPAIAAAGRAWAREICREDDPEKQELHLLRNEMRSLRAEYNRVTSRRFYRWSESLARLAWRLAGSLGGIWRRQG